MEKNKRPSEWARCSEGFSDFKSYSNNTGSAARGRKSMKRRSGDVFRSRITSVDNRDQEAISEDILWSSSDSEDNMVSEIPLGKRKKISKQSSPNKKKSPKCSQITPLARCDSVDIVASDSDTEKPSDILKNSGSVKEGSIQGYESASEEEQVQSVSEKDVEATESPSISGSTQSVSPPPTNTGLGVKASDWVRSLQLKTPSKSESREELITAEDSAKKKKKLSKGGLAGQLSRLQAREKSSVRMWSHQQNKGPSGSQDNSKTISLKVLGFEALYSMQIVKCSVLGNSVDKEHRLVMFPGSQGEQLNLQVGTEVTVYPPWQQLEMNDGQSIMLCTRYCQVTYQPEGEIDSKKSGLSTVKNDTVTATWNCPCVQGLCKVPSTCPAYKYPSLPGLLAAMDSKTSDKQNALPECKDRLTSPEKHLHTVAKKEKKVVTVSDSLLGSIEICSEHSGKRDTGPVMVTFRGTVHRVNKTSSGTEKKYLLLVEDGHGAVCEVQLQGRDLKEIDLRLEGKAVQFSGLTVKCRKTRDKDLSLFSLIDSVWSGTKGAIDSQDSQNSVTEGKQTLTVEPPSFCYILTCEDPDSLSITPSTIGSLQSKPVSYTKLSDITPKMNIKRCSCTGRVLYILNDTEVDPSHSGTVLFITDQSLHMSPTPYIKCHVTCKFKSIPVMTDCGNHVFHLKDAFIDQGQLTADLYTKILIETSENNNDGVDSKKIQLPSLDGSIQKMDLCSVEGNISEVDEDSAYSWEACNFCSSDQLLSQTTESGDSSRSVMCKNCHKQVTSPEVKMKMEVLLKYTAVSNIVIRVDLLQSTIENLLPRDEEAEEGYELSSVLNKPLGPLNCIVISCSETNGQKYMSLREIDLLLQNS